MCYSLKTKALKESNIDTGNPITLPLINYCGSWLKRGKSLQFLLLSPDLYMFYYIDAHQ